MNNPFLEPPLGCKFSIDIRLKDNFPPSQCDDETDEEYFGRLKDWENTAHMKRWKAGLSDGKQQKAIESQLFDPANPGTVRGGLICLVDAIRSGILSQAAKILINKES